MMMMMNLLLFFFAQTSSMGPSISPDQTDKKVLSETKPPSLRMAMEVPAMKQVESATWEIFSRSSDPTKPSRVITLEPDRPVWSKA